MNKITWKITVKLIKCYWPIQRIHNYIYSKIRDKNRTKIFCIGGPKTGTTSLIKALKILGYKAVHIFQWPTWKKYGGEAYIEILKKSGYDAFADWPLGEEDLYKKIDKAIPNSKFILTVREVKALEKSYSNFYKNSPWGYSILPYMSEQMEFQEKRNKEVIDYFKDRNSQFLVMNITKGDGWEKLCKFLNKPIPNKPFPRKNVGHYRKRKK